LFVDGLGNEAQDSAIVRSVTAEGDIHRLLREAHLRHALRPVA
jgi:hypothetical protein